MPITNQQKASADRQQLNAAVDSTLQIRLIAGPGTGKSGTIIKRVIHLLQTGVNPNNLYVISFTRATCAELLSRIINSCANGPLEQLSKQVRVSTMHSLALKILRRTNQLIQYPSDPVMLDSWEQSNIYDQELAANVPCTPTRAGQIRLAHDARWQTLNPAMINQAQITSAEINAFNAFHSTRTNLYCCVLPGEVVFKCVEAFQLGSIQLQQLPTIDHLIVDEFQDLNSCDQEFVRFLTQNGSILFVAGDDDQSIYSFRHADPTGIIDFVQSYPTASTHILSDCFRCTPSILNSATTLIQYNPNRIQKNVVSIYESSNPPVQGRIDVWSFPTAQDEAKAVATSCYQLIESGMAGREDEILILISNRKLQLELLTVELGNLGLPFDTPRGESLSEDKGIRAVYSLLRICEEHEEGNQYYITYRTLLHLLKGVGIQTSKEIADSCIINNQNFRQLFDLPILPHWLTVRAKAAVQRIISIVQIARSWSLSDTIETRKDDITNSLVTHIFLSNEAIDAWTYLVNSLPVQMTLRELLLFLSTENESDQQIILDLVNKRIGVNLPQDVSTQKKIKILTMHGAKGLSGKVVFIPSCEQGILPSYRAIQAAGLVIEQRRLFYVSVTRAMSACIISHVGRHTDAQAFFLRQRPIVRLTRSQFLNELRVPSVNRSAGLSQAESDAIVANILNL